MDLWSLIFWVSLCFLGFVIVMLIVRLMFRINEQISLLKEIRDYLKTISKTDGTN
jgi:hypothetical protein